MESRQLRRRPETRRVLKGLKPLVGGKVVRGYQMADSTRDMRRSVYTRELKTKFGNQKLTETPTRTCEP